MTVVRNTPRRRNSQASPRFRAGPILFEEFVDLIPDGVKVNVRWLRSADRPPAHDVLHRLLHTEEA
jgi:hypothetical protein